MMKKIYFFLLLFIASMTAARAQRTIDLELQPTKYAQQGNISNLQPLTAYTLFIHDGKTGYMFSLPMKNLGPDSIMKNDTIFIKPGWGLPSKLLYTQDTGIKTNQTLAAIPFNQQNQTIFLTFAPPPGMPIPSLDTINWCDSIWLVAGSGNTPIVDPDMTNNYRCENVKIQAMWAVGVNDIALRESDFTIYPNPATEKLTIQFEARSSGNATITLRDMMGKTVYNRSLSGTTGSITHNVDVAHLPPGLYTAEFQYNNQSIVRKITIQ